jgi:hypothetical protein
MEKFAKLFGELLAFTIAALVSSLRRSSSGT